MRTKKFVYQLFALFVIAATLLSACGPKAASGQLNVIALPHDWCGYGAVIDAFKAKYPEITVNELNPDAGSGDEIEAIKANKDNKGPQAPDVIDVGLSFGPTAKADGLLMPYKVSTWDSIPDSAKDADGAWYGDYYGVLAFEVNKDIVKESPQDWPDLLKPEYANSVALGGEPRTSNQGIQGIYAAGIAAGAAPGAAAGEAGLKFFAEVSKAGNFIPVTGRAASLAQGSTPIIIRWDYNALTDKVELAGNPDVDVVVPPSGVLAGVYIQAISAHAPHPNAAKLWMEYLYSDEGQLLWLKGYCHPIRFKDMSSRGVISADAAAKLPKFDGPVAFPSIDQINASKKIITDNWMTTVGADVK